MNPNTPLVERNRRVTPKEIAALRAAVGWERCEDTQARVLRGSYSHFTIHDKNRPVAFLSVISDGVGDALLVNVIVHPQFQKRGFGRALVSGAIGSLSGDGIQCVWTTFVPEMEPFYRKCGLHIVRGGVWDNADPKRKRGPNQLVQRTGAAAHR